MGKGGMKVKENIFNNLLFPLVIINLPAKNLLKVKVRKVFSTLTYTFSSLTLSPQPLKFASSSIKTVAQQSKFDNMRLLASVGLFLLYIFHISTDKRCVVFY